MYMKHNFCIIKWNIYFILSRKKNGGFNFVLAEVDDVLFMKTKQKIQILKKICEPGMHLFRAAVQTYVSTTNT